IRFHYYLGRNETPTAVMQRVKLTSHQSVNSTAWMFERLGTTFPAAKCGSIVNTADLEATERKTRAFLSILDRLSTTIDLADERLALDRVRQLV
ncbi:unnamed protein product, partial [marine sediment metagenome]